MSPPGSRVVRLPSVPALSWDDCRLLVESVADYAIFMLDVDGRVATWNLGAEKINGYEAAEIIGEYFAKFFPAEDVAAGKPERELEVAKEVGRFEDENWRVRKNGTRFWASVVITALRDASGTLRGFGKVTRDLSARRAAEERSRQAEERFHLLVDAVTDYAIFLLDPDGRVATWNSGARRLKGYLEHEIIGRHFSAFYPEEDQRAGKPQRIMDVVRSEGRYEELGWRVRKDGSRFWANVVITSLRDNSTGEFLGFAKITRDLTERRLAEEYQQRLIREQTAREVAEASERRIQESEARYRALSRRLEAILEGIQDGITVQDGSGNLVFANAAAALLCEASSVDELVQTPSADVTGRFEILDEAGNPIPTSALPGRSVLRGEKADPLLMQVRERRTGRQSWSLVNATAVPGEDGSPELAVNIVRDVTQERRQRERERYVAEATSALGGSIVSDEMLTNLAGALTAGMGDWCSIYLKEGELLRHVVTSHRDEAKAALARAYTETFPPDPDHAGGAWGVVRTGSSAVYNDITEDVLLTFARDPGARATLREVGTRSVLLVPIKVRDRVLGVLGLGSSETALRYEPGDVASAEEVGRRAGVALENAQLYVAAQDAAARAEASARRAERAVEVAEEAGRAKDEFLATVSHELRTPLNAILGWATLLKDRVTDPSLAKPLHVIHRNAQAQVKIIEDILDVSRVITGKFRLELKPADLLAIARDALEVVRPSATAKKLHVLFTPSPHACLLLADPERLQQAVLNLLSNAVKFTEAGGSIEIEVKQERSALTLTVTDSGKGIEPGFLPHVFERFRQADSSTTRRVGGLGLGLALVRHIVELHGGQVTAASEGLGKGSAFSICLPVVAVFPAPSAGASPSAAVSPAIPADTLSGVRVLLVDDEADARDLIATVLVEQGAEVETAQSAAEGFEVFGRFHPDVVVSDIGMPGEDGYSFIRRIRTLPVAEGGNVPSLALTAFARDDDRTRALGAGFTTHVGKPVKPDVLVSAVANISKYVARG